MPPFIDSKNVIEFTMAVCLCVSVCLQAAYSSVLEVEKLSKSKSHSIMLRV